MLKVAQLLSLPTNLTPAMDKIESSIPLKLKANVVKNMPKVLKPTLKLVPFTVQKQLLLPALNSVFSEAIDDGDFEFLQGKWLKIAITDLQLNWWLSFDDGQLIMASHKDNISEDVSFSANGDDLILIAGRQQDPDTLFFKRCLKIEGDTELGLEVKNLIDAIDIEQLPSKSHYLVERCARFLQRTQEQLHSDN